MIRLTMPKGPTRIDIDGLPYPLWLRVRPPSSPLIEAAKAKAFAAGRALMEQVAAVVAAGGDVTGLLDLSDPDAAHGHSITAYAVALAELAIIEWGGAAVEDPQTAQIVPVSPAIIAELMKWPDLPAKFLDQYLAPLARAVTEGNALGAASPGT
jgi:hypothetical protein